MAIAAPGQIRLSATVCRAVALKLLDSPSLLAGRRLSVSILLTGVPFLVVYRFCAERLTLACRYRHHSEIRHLLDGMAWALLAPAALLDPAGRLLIRSSARCGIDVHRAVFELLGGG